MIYIDYIYVYIYDNVYMYEISISMHASQKELHFLQMCESRKQVFKVGSEVQGLEEGDGGEESGHEGNGGEESGHEG